MYIYYITEVGYLYYSCFGSGCCISSFNMYLLNVYVIRGNICRKHHFTQSLYSCSELWHDYITNVQGKHTFSKFMILYSSTIWCRWRNLLARGHSLLVHALYTGGPWLHAVNHVIRHPILCNEYIQWWCDMYTSNLLTKLLLIFSWHQ